MKKRKPIVIAKQTIEAGTAGCIKLSLAMLYTSTPIQVPVYVFHGKKEGPVLFVTAAIHGDEINGVEIIRRLHRSPLLRLIRGTLLTIPVVNVYGFLLHSRYLPDRRDLNRQFPGHPEGSMASLLANLLITEIVQQSTHGIDLHTGASHRSNYPQTRFSHGCDGSAALAQAFAAPIMIPAARRDGSLRHATDQLKIPSIVYESGEALRFDELSIKLGVRGILRVMAYLDMFPPSRSHALKVNTKVATAQSTFWVRATVSGMIIEHKLLGTKIHKNDLLCRIADPLGNSEVEIFSPCDGIIIGKTNIPLVNTGDGLYHIALFENFDNGF